MPTFIANRNMTYNTRRLKAGDQLSLSRRDGDLLVRLGRVTQMPDALAQSALVKPTAPVMPPVPVAAATPVQPAADTLATARADYEAAVGKRAFHGWDEAELRRRIAEHQDAGSS
jgi:hypothetical protein